MFFNYGIDFVPLFDQDMFNDKALQYAQADMDQINASAEEEDEKKKLLPCLHPKLPLELETMIYSHLSINDLSSLTDAFRTSQDILYNDKYSNQGARMMIIPEMKRLRKDVEYLHFTGLSLVTAYRRYIKIFGLLRDHKFAPKTLASRRAYFQANPDVCERLSDLQLVIGVALMISDWLQQDQYGTFCTPLAQCVDETPGLEAALRIACLEPWNLSTDGACAKLVAVWQSEIGSSWSAHFIIQLFREVRAKPLEDLRIVHPMPLGRPGEEDDPDLEDGLDLSDDSESEDEMGIHPLEFTELPEFLRDKLDLPTTYFGFAVHVGTYKRKGNLLIS